MGNQASSESNDTTSPKHTTAPRAGSVGSVGRRAGSVKGKVGSFSKNNHSSSPTTALVPPPASATAQVSIVSASPTHSHSSSHSRARSITTSSVHASPQDLSTSTASISMGAADSKPAAPARPPSRSNTLPIHHRSGTPDNKASPPSAESASQPLDVPPPSNHDARAEADQDDYIPSGYSESPYGLPPANYSRPPRLPLPIEEEVHTPGSPIISPQDITSPLEQSDVEGGAIPRKASVLSSTTVDEDDVGDNDAFSQDASQTLQVRVPTRLEWNGGGEKIFVTGTFCNWEKKIKLPRNKDGKEGFSANIHLPPGTHHIKFLVDGDMVTSPGLPTTVDWTNILVNYIEVVAPLPPATEDEKQGPAPAEPMPIPGAAMTAGQAVATPEPAARPRTDAHVPETEADVPSTLQQTDGSKSIEPPAPGTASVPIPASATPVQRQPEPKQDAKPTPAAPRQRIPRPRYTNHIPQFLIDLDNYQHPEDEKFQRAQKVANTLPQPPTLPMFLGKSILNGATPHKDDASVLLMPNHTVINHLATSSIRSGVLATSGTTRYKRKVCLSIL